MEIYKNFTDDTKNEEELNVDNILDEDIEYQEWLENKIHKNIEFILNSSSFIEE